MRDARLVERRAWKDAGFIEGCAISREAGLVGCGIWRECGISREARFIGTRDW